MNTLILLSSCFVLALVILAKIPGLEHTVRPIIDLIFTLIKVIIENAYSWFIWLVKGIWGSHLELFSHLTNAAEDLDATIAVKGDEL